MGAWRHYKMKNAKSKMKNEFVVFLSLLFLPFVMSAQEDSTSIKPKKRFSFSGLPVVASDADMGFQ
jgi:hypothetical protein